LSRTIFSALIAPAGVALATLVAWLAVGAGWAIAALALGASALFAFHLGHVVLLIRWAEGPLEAPVPEGRGTWRRAFTGLYRRARTRFAVERGLTQRPEKFAAGAEAIPAAGAVPEDANRIRFAIARPRAHL